MADFAAQMANPSDLSEEQQKKAGQPTGGDMDAEHKNFCTTITKLFETGAIDVTRPETFLNRDVYDRLEPEWKTKTDISLMNIATLLGHIYDFYKSKQTPDACPQLASMIDQLWEMKQRIETHADVFKF
jgi:hypothetical protein